MMSPRHLLAGRGSGSGAVDAALLVLRVFAGVAFVLHGWGKVADVSGFAAEQGVPVVLGAAAGDRRDRGHLAAVYAGKRPASQRYDVRFRKA